MNEATLDWSHALGQDKRDRSIDNTGNNLVVGVFRCDRPCFLDLSDDLVVIRIFRTLRGETIKPSTKSLLGGFPTESHLKRSYKALAPFSPARRQAR